MHLNFHKSSGNSKSHENSPSTSQGSTPSEDPPSYDFTISSTASNESLTNAPSPIKRPSSSIIARGSPSKSQKPQKNIPYRPSDDLKKHSKILSNSNESSLLSPASSNTQTEYFDVLPSFQMFQSILKRDDSQFSENLSVNPPIYGDVTNSSPTPPSGLSPVSSNRDNNLDSMMDSLTERINEYALNNNNDEENYIFGEEEQDNNQPNEHLINAENTPIASNDTYGETVLDNIDRLPKLNNSPIDIQIYVTKRVPQPNLPNDLETRLKMYSSGDLVNGYIIITNTSDEPVDFGLFVVTLDGTIKTTHTNPNANPLDIHKYDKVLIKKFLKMYDLNASYGYTQIPNSAGIEYEAFTKDLHDGCELGLPNERILKPHTKYKKFFTFKFPHKLLDNNCIHDVLPHILPPPSMGIDRTCFYNRGGTIALNKALGYGFLNVRGTPLLTKDYSFENISVSYTIEAKFIDKLNAKNQKDPLSQHEINDPNSLADYVISKNSQYYLRFVPDFKEKYKYYNEGFHYGTGTFGAIGIDGKLFENFLHLNTWRQIYELNYSIEKEIDSKLAREEFKDQDMKQKNLSIDCTLTDSNIYFLNMKEHFLQNNCTQFEFNEDQQLRDEKMIGSKIPVTIYGKKKKKILSSLVRIGELKLHVRVPHKVVPYASPKLLMKYNNENLDDFTTLRTVASTPLLSEKNKLASVKSNELTPRMSATSSTSISDLYNRSESDVLGSVDILLSFVPFDNATKPPQINSIETNLVFWTYNTEFPLPVKLEYDFFYANPDENKSKLLDDVEITRNNLQSLKDQVYNYIQFLQANKIYISKASYLYLKSIKTLGIKKDTVKEYFKTISNSTNPELLNNEQDWKAKQMPNKNIKWERELKIPLTTINKNNINLIPSFQSCLVGRIYCLQVLVKYKGGGGDQDEFADNIVKIDVPILVG
ncbi:unnamed protein product [Debaryomyces fabryi]|nr:unnamed protein product [Debaryomyces fabryi]